MGTKTDLHRFQPTDGASPDIIRVVAGTRSDLPISRYLTGKFCEHLCHNIYNGMHAQILQNPTFADYPFGGGPHPDGGHKVESDEERIAERIRAEARHREIPEPDKLIESRADALAHRWIREGAREAIAVSPEAGPHGGRAQRIEVSNGGQGLAQWVHLPLHRVLSYQWRLVARSPDLRSLKITAWPGDRRKPRASAEVPGLTRSWQTLTGTLEIDDSAPETAMYRFTITAPQAGQFVIERVLLYPADHAGGADPDVISLLKESRLPLLRWPGGNFVSGYHWEDGVGPVDGRPTRPNLAWGIVEPNLFGTDEFLAFCREVGCEPLICVNAGDGTPQEAARWVEYCNGAPDTDGGKLRAANGHPEPHSVRYWEIGNEVYGRWQKGWTTPAGYADRHREFSEAMRAADPSIELLACGESAIPSDWNDRLLAQGASTLTHHLLVGGRVPATADPLDVYRDFMAVPGVYARKYEQLRRAMLAAGIADPRLAITELQLFARLDESTEGATRLTHDNLVSPGTLAEALYDTLLYHEAVRTAPFIEIITHSATVNHGGGLRKQQERVYANPCHYAQTLFAKLAGAHPVQVELQCPEQQAAGVLSCTPAGTGTGILDVLAAITPDGDLLVSIVHRGTQDPRSLSILLDGFPAGAAEIWRLGAEVPWAANSLDEPERVKPTREETECTDGLISLTIQPYSLAQIRICPRRTLGRECGNQSRREG